MRREIRSRGDDRRVSAIGEVCARGGESSVQPGDQNQDQEQVEEKTVFRKRSGSMQLLGVMIAADLTVCM